MCGGWKQPFFYVVGSRFFPMCGLEATRFSLCVVVGSNSVFSLCVGALVVGSNPFSMCVVGSRFFPMCGGWKQPVFFHPGTEQTDDKFWRKVLV